MEVEPLEETEPLMRHALAIDLQEPRSAQHWEGLGGTLFFHPRQFNILNH